MILFFRVCIRDSIFSRGPDACFFCFACLQKFGSVSCMSVVFSAGHTIQILLLPLSDTHVL